MAKDDRPRPVQITSPGYVKDRTNHLRIQKDAAQRLIARYLREKMTPADANDMANGSATASYPTCQPAADPHSGASA